jgi:hypothetical protein
VLSVSALDLAVKHIRRFEDIRRTRTDEMALPLHQVYACYHCMLSLLLVSLLMVSACYHCYLSHCLWPFTDHSL